MSRLSSRTGTARAGTPHQHRQRSLGRQDLDRSGEQQRGVRDDQGAAGVEQHLEGGQLRRDPGDRRDRVAGLELVGGVHLHGHADRLDGRPPDPVRVTRTHLLAGPGAAGLEAAADLVGVVAGRSRCGTAGCAAPRRRSRRAGCAASPGSCPCLARCRCSVTGLSRHRGTPPSSPPAPRSPIRGRTTHCAARSSVSRTPRTRRPTAERVCSRLRTAPADDPRIGGRPRPRRAGRARVRPPGWSRTGPSADEGRRDGGSCGRAHRADPRHLRQGAAPASRGSARTLRDRRRESVTG